MAAFNRNSAVELYHDGTKKIETTSSGLKVTAANSAGTAFQLYNTDSSANVWYVNGEGNSFQGHIYPRTTDNLDLGYVSGYKWRDIILSGGIRFGSTNSTDYLDDYEEGTWTPDWRGASALGTTSYGTYNAASYVKIGNQVTVRGFSEIAGSAGGSGTWFINNLPFYNGGGDDRRYRSVGQARLENFNVQTVEEGGDIHVFVERNNNDLTLSGNRDNQGASTAMMVSQDSSFEITFTVTYQTT